VLLVGFTIEVKLYVWIFFENLSRIFYFHYIWARITSTVHADQYTFLIISRSVLMRNISDKSLREKTLFVFKSPPPDNRAVYEITRKNIVEPNSPQMKICRMRIACWITKATNTYSAYVILLFHCSNGYANAPQCYVIHTLRGLLSMQNNVARNK